MKIHKIELNTKQLQHLLEEQQKLLADDMSSDEDEVMESILSSLIKEMCAKWGDTMLTNRAVYIINDNAMMHIRKVLQHGQKQLTLDKFLANKARKATAEEEESTASKRQRREITPKRESLSFLMESDSPKKGMQRNKVKNKVNYYALLSCFTLLYIYILICFINTPHFQIIYNCIDVSRHSSERINRLLTISYGKYCFTFRTNQLSTRFFNELCLTSKVPLYIYIQVEKKISLQLTLHIEYLTATILLAHPVYIHYVHIISKNHFTCT